MIEQLYTAYRAEILKYCVSLSKNYALAEDITQETFLRALGNVDTLEGLELAQRRAWLYRTARNIFIDKIRQEKRRVDEEEERIFEEDYSKVIVEQICRCLTDEEKTIFFLRHMEGYNATELGEMLDIPASTIRAKLATIRKKLAKEYKD